MAKPVLRWLFFAFVFAAGVAMLTWREASLQTPRYLRTIFLPAPQGSATLMITPEGKTMLIGGGKDFSVFEEMGQILPFFNRTIDLLVVPDARTVSLTTLTELSERCTVRRTLLPSPLPDTLTIHRDILDAHHVPVTDMEWNSTIDIGAGLTLAMINRGKSKPAIVTINAENVRLDLPGSSDDLTGDFSASILRGILRKDGLPETVVIRDPKQEAWLKNVTIRNLATEGRVTLSLE